MWGETTDSRYVFETKLDVDGVDDSSEEDPGGYLAYNDDDDDGDGVPDYDETTENTAEDDLVEITLIDCLPGDLSDGYLQLKVECDTAGSIKVWDSPTKGEEDPNLVVEGPGDVQWAIADVPAELWVEGSGYGAGVLSLRYSPDGTSFPGTCNADVVDVTNVHVEMIMDGVAENDEESVGGDIAVGSDSTELDLYSVSPGSVAFDSDHPVSLDVLFLYYSSFMNS